MWFILLLTAVMAYPTVCEKMCNKSIIKIPVNDCLLRCEKLSSPSLQDNCLHLPEELAEDLKANDKMLEANVLTSDDAVIIESLLKDGINFLTMCIAVVLLFVIICCIQMCCLIRDIRKMRKSMYTSYSS